MSGKRNTVLRALAAGGLALYLAGCGGGLQQSLGLGKRAPDATRVVEQAPLEVPPDFALRPPSPGAPRPQDTPARDRAAALVVGAAADADPDAAASAHSPGEQAFRNMAGANEADPAIRQIVNREAAVFAPEDPDFIDDLMFWQTSAPPGTALDPVAEAERLRGNEAAGRGVTEGESPVIVHREKAPLEGLNPF